MNKLKNYNKLMKVLCLIMTLGFALSLLFGISSTVFATNDYQIVYDDYNGADLIVNRYEKVNLPTATFKERGVTIGKAELYVYDSEQNLVPSYRKGAYLFTEVGEYTAIYRPIGYADRGVDGGDKNLVLNITVNDAELLGAYLPVDSDLQSGVVADYNEDFYLTDVFTDYGKASIYRAEYPTVSLSQLDGDNKAIKLVKGENYAKIGLYFGAGIDKDITEFSYLAIKLKTDATEIYFAGLTDYKFYKMTDLATATMGDFSYDENGYQTAYVKAQDLGLTKDYFDGVQLVFNGADGAFVEIDEISFVHDRKDYKFVSSVTKSELAYGDSMEIVTLLYLNGVQIESPILKYEIPEQYEAFSSVTTDGTRSYFNALQAGKTALRITYYDSDGQTVITSQDIPLNILSAREVVDRLASSLKTNEVVTWGDVNYKYAVQKTVFSSGNPDIYSVTVNPNYNQVRYINSNSDGEPAYGSVRILFPGSPTYTDGYLRITCIFDGYNSNRAVKVYKFNETDSNNPVATFDAFTGTRGGVDREWYVWIIPASELVDQNGVLEGIQIVNTSSWMNFGRIDYIPESEYEPSYSVFDNVSALPFYENGESCTVESYLERDGFKLNNADYYIEITSSENAVMCVSGMEVTPLSSGTATITVSYYSDSTKQTLLASRSTEVVIDTAENILSATLTGNKLVAWDHVLYEKYVTDCTVNGLSMANESYQSFVNDDFTKGYYFDFVPASMVNDTQKDYDGSGRTIIFPVQKTYTDGYVKLKLVSQGGNTFKGYMTITVYKIGETEQNNYILKATGNDLLEGLTELEIYVPVNMLTNEEDLLCGLQIAVAGGGWTQIHEIYYVPEAEYQPTYTVSHNLLDLALAEGGSEKTVTATMLYDGMMVGSQFNYTATLSGDNDQVALVSGMKVTPVKEGEVTLTLTLKDKDDNDLASVSEKLSVTSLYDTITSTLGENEFVNWDNQLYMNYVSEGTVTGSQIDERYADQIKSDDLGNYFVFVPYNSDPGTGKTITFPVQKVYTDGYVELTFLKEKNGNFAYYEFITIYKYGETDPKNYVLKGYGTDGYSMKDTNVVTLRVPVGLLTDDQGVLKGLQFMAGYCGYLHVYSIKYVPETSFEPEYTVTDNISSLTFAYGGTAQTVTASMLYDGFAVGSSFVYTVELESSNTQVVTVSGMAITPINGGKTTISIIIKNNLGNQVVMVEREISVTSIEELIAPSLGTNELVNFQSNLQFQLITETTIPEYQGNESKVERHTGGWGCFKFWATDTAKAIGYNVEFAVKNSYDDGYILLPLMSQRTGVALEVYKFGTTSGEPVYTTTLNTANTFSFHYIPVTDLANEQGVIEGVQIVMLVKDGYGQICGSTDGQNVNAIKYVSEKDRLASMLGENELINWNSSLQADLVTGTTITDYAEGIAEHNGIVTRNNALAYQITDVTDAKLAGLNFEFAKKLTNPTGYVEFTMQCTQIWEGGKVYVCKYGETNVQNIGEELGTCSAQNTNYTFYVPVEDLVDSNGVLQGIQIIFHGSGGYVYFFGINLVAEIPA